MPQRSTSFSSDEDRWTAVLRRDAQADGAFYYSVSTTGVFCRPSCPSRHPRRENVSFHQDIESAVKAGFRPCKRCKPDQAALDERHAEAVLKACRLIENAEMLPSLHELAQCAGMSSFHFHRIFKSVTGVTPKGYAASLRSQRVRKQIIQSASITQASYDAGFNSGSRFYAATSEILGMKPSNFRTGGAGLKIRFGVGECSLGSILVAATEKGICSIQLGDAPEKLVHELQDLFPRAELIGGDTDFEQWMAHVIAHVESPGTAIDLPLDIRGTVFQQRVWKALREIPAGSTVSYAELARRLDMPDAARAVAGACAANMLAVAIPCHRVVRTDGSLSGYRWGIERKRALLDREKT
jgi:AraC family transcriptional regulator of adaptative response/methylated-DNA-[protein]-cysteine methyltransferase